MLHSIHLSKHKELALVSYQNLQLLYKYYGSNEKAAEYYKLFASIPC